MSSEKKLTFLFRKYPLLRLGSIILVMVLAIGILAVISINAKKLPHINSVMPPVGAPGDIMVINGTDFGITRTNGCYVEVGGSRITSSGYLSWNDTEIRVILPTNVQDGLVIVGTKNGQSKPGFFANEAGIPVEVPPDTRTTLPVISSISPESGSYGNQLIITGTNFGTTRGSSAIYFSANRDDAQSASLVSSTQEDNLGTFNPALITPSESNFDYEYWSDSEIHVRIPDGAASGPLYIQTEKGESNHIGTEVTFPAGNRSYTERKTYLLQVFTDVENQNTKNATNLTLRIPRPIVNAQQPMTELTDCSPEPIFSDYKNTIIHQVELPKNSAKKVRFTQNFAVAVYSVQTEITGWRVKNYSEKTRLLYQAALNPDSLVPCQDEKVVALAKTIIGKEKNPYTQANLVYNYMLDTFKLSEKARNGEESPLRLLSKKDGDAYDFAIIFTALCRALKIPAMPMSGVLVDSDLKTMNHWWAQIYFENVGWIPVDPALGAGLSYKAFRPLEDPKTFYFGNLDSQHIAFSQGWNDIKPSLIQSKTVYRPRSYAFQSIWEESDSENVNYSTLWNPPVVLGIY